MVFINPLSVSVNICALLLSGKVNCVFILKATKIQLIHFLEMYNNYKWSLNLQNFQLNNLYFLMLIP